MIFLGVDVDWQVASKFTGKYIGLGLWCRWPLWFDWRSGGGQVPIPRNLVLRYLK